MFQRVFTRANPALPYKSFVIPHPPKKFLPILRWGWQKKRKEENKEIVSNKQMLSSSQLGMNHQLSCTEAGTCLSPAKHSLARAAAVDHQLGSPTSGSQLLVLEHKGGRRCLEVLELFPSVLGPFLAPLMPCAGTRDDECLAALFFIWNIKLRSCTLLNIKHPMIVMKKSYGFY